jgi:FAD synthase
LRGTKAFPNLDQLLAQIRADIEETRLVCRD